MEGHHLDAALGAGVSGQEPRPSRVVSGWGAGPCYLTGAFWRSSLSIRCASQVRRRAAMSEHPSCRHGCGQTTQWIVPEGNIRRVDCSNCAEGATEDVNCELLRAVDSPVTCQIRRRALEYKCHRKGYSYVRCLAPEDGQGSGHTREPRISRPLYGIRQEASKVLFRHSRVLQNPHSWVQVPPSPPD